MIAKHHVMIFVATTTLDANIELHRVYKTRCHFIFNQQVMLEKVWDLRVFPRRDLYQNPKNKMI